MNAANAHAAAKATTADAEAGLESARNLLLKLLKEDPPDWELIEAATEARDRAKEAYEAAQAAEETAKEAEETVGNVLRAASQNFNAKRVARDAAQRAYDECIENCDCGTGDCGTW